MSQLLDTASAPLQTAGLFLTQMEQPQVAVQYQAAPGLQYVQPQYASVVPGAGQAVVYAASPGQQVVQQPGMLVDQQYMHPNSVNQQYMQQFYQPSGGMVQNGSMQYAQPVYGHVAPGHTDSMGYTNAPQTLQYTQNYWPQ
jgi:hypothetical protein